MKIHIFICTSILHLSGCKPSDPPPVETASQTTRWEYMQTVSYSKNFPTGELNKLGQQGWELVSIIEERQSGHFTKFTLKRNTAGHPSPAPAE